MPQIILLNLFIESKTSSRNVSANNYTIHQQLPCEDTRRGVWKRGSEPHDSIKPGFTVGPSSCQELKVCEVSVVPMLPIPQSAQVSKWNRTICMILHLTEQKMDAFRQPSGRFFWEQIMGGVFFFFLLKWFKDNRRFLSRVFHFHLCWYSKCVWKTKVSWDDISW